MFDYQKVIELIHRLFTSFGKEIVYSGEDGQFRGGRVDGRCGWFAVFLAGPYSDDLYFTVSRYYNHYFNPIKPAPRSAL